MNKKWIPSQAANYDSITINETGVYYDGYNNLLDLVVEWACVDSNSRVLDIGTGTGELSKRFSIKTKCSVVGIDPSNAMLEEAKKKAERENRQNVDFRYSPDPFLRIPKNLGRFDVIATTNAFHHVPDKDKQSAIIEMSRFLKKGGRIVIGDIMFENLAAMEDAFKKWPDELEVEYFTILENQKNIFTNARMRLIGQKKVGEITWVVSAIKED